jgi:cytochrome oxidase Cu insertion factor (SCO1/SenC/PrrC family)
MNKQIVALLFCAVFIAALTQSVFAKDLQKELARVFPWKGPEIGSVVNDFELKTYEGKNFKLSEQRGKIVVLEMGACT